ncbi:MAG: asparaginase [Chloroflexi bacterium]|nr:asparaginase [Chloroflexota bacterium]
MSDKHSIMSIPADVALAYTVRGEAIDCVHYGSVVVVDALGTVLFSLGDSHRLTFERSITKPAKAVAVIQHPLASYSPSTDHIALMAGSHSGTQAHITVLKNMLQSLSLSESELLCGTTLPIGDDAILELIQNKGQLSPLHSDCSGEHIGLISLCKSIDLEYTNYTHLDHPVQEIIRNTLTLFSDYDHSIAETAVDGCNLPTYQVPLYNMALMMARLCPPVEEPKELTLVLDAISREPLLYGGGSDRFVTNLIKTTQGRIIAKDGAEGLFVLGWRGKGIGLAIKIADGNHRAANPVVISIIRKLGLLSEEDLEIVEAVSCPPLFSHTGLQVGKVISLH